MISRWSPLVAATLAIAAIYAAAGDLQLLVRPLITLWW